MTRLILPLAVACVLVAAPAVAQTASGPQPVPPGQARLGPLSNVLADAQRRLDQLGYSARPTGQLDDQTRQATIRFQSDHGLRQTGELDLTTLAMLGVPVQPTGQSSAMLPRE